MKIEIKSSVSHITATGITIDILINVDGEVSTLTITSHQNGARDWRYVVAMTSAVTNAMAGSQSYQ